MKWYAKRFISLVIACIMALIGPLDAFALAPEESLESYLEEEPEYDYFLSSDSNSFYMDDGELPGDYGIMPLVVGVDDAFYVVCAAIFAICGVVVSGDDLVSLADTFYFWVRDRMQDWSDAYQAITAVRGLTVGVVVSGLQEILKAAKAFFADIKGYGTSTNSYSVSKYIPVPNVADPVAHGKCVAGDYVCFASFITYGSKLGDYEHREIFSNVMPKAAYNKTFLYGMDDTGVPLYCNIAYSVDWFEGYMPLYSTPRYKHFGSTSYHDWPLIDTYPPYNYFSDIPYFSTLAAATYYLTTGTIRDMNEVIYAPSGIAVKPIVDAQTVNIGDISISNDITVPEMALLEQLLSNVVTKEDIKVALKDVIALDYAGGIVIPTDVPIPSESAGEGEETTDPYLPWVPDITGRLDGLLGGLKDIGNFVTDIPGKISEGFGDLTADLGRVVDGVVAIPGEIASFFTIDTAAIGEAYGTLTGTFQGRFSGITQLGDVFNQQRKFSEEPPVFTMQTPDALKFAIKSDTMVVLDLRPHAEIFKWVRLLLNASIWYLFAWWVLNQFDVKFHIG